MKQEKIKLKMLLVDDDEQTRMIISDLLDDTIIEVIESANGNEVLDIFIRNRAEIFLVLLDIWLPGCDGWQIIKLIRQIDPVVPVIAISAATPAEIIAHSAAAGFTDYMIKPLDLNRLRKMIMSYLETENLGNTST